MKPFRYFCIISALGATAFSSSISAAQAEVPARLARPELVEQAFAAARSATQSADSAASVRAFGWKILPESPDYRIWLDDNRPSVGSRSVGSVGTGSLINAAPFPVEGPFHQVIERHRNYGTQWSTDEMVATLMFAAKYVGESAPGAPVRFGNLSKRAGGDIRWSRSHNSGRDADVAFLVTDETGNSVPTPELLQFDARGVPDGRPDLMFDVRRNWLFIKGLLTNPDEVVIQYVFVSEPLKAMLLQYATSTGESESLVAKAADVLHQPTDALPHDDHFHVRIACPLEDRLRGCLDSGPSWAWANWHRDALQAQALQLANGLDDPEPSVRLAVLDFLDRIGSPYSADIALGVGVWSPDPAVRERSLTLAKSSWNWSGFALANAMRLIQSEATTDDEKAVAYGILRRSIDGDARDFALARLLDDTVDPAERAMAARSLGHFMDPSLVPTLFDELLRQPGGVRVEIADVLMRILNYGPDVEWRGCADGCVAAVATWRQWAATHGTDHNAWVLAGFRAIGLRVETLSPASLDVLVQELPKANPYIAYNLNRVLREQTGRWAPLELTDGRKLHSYWSDWWRKNRERVMDRGVVASDE
ncbi:MAG: penicillin-insensitive murein endopeptidase [bacterium]